MMPDSPEQLLAFLRGETNDPGVVRVVRGGIRYETQPDVAACRIVADAIVSSAAEYRTRLRLADDEPLVATVPPTLTPADRAHIGERVAGHAVTVETVSPRPGDEAGLGTSVQFLIHQRLGWHRE